MSALEAFQLAVSSGVLAGGFGMARWALMVERRLMRLEVKTQIEVK